MDGGDARPVGRPTSPETQTPKGCKAESEPVRKFPHSITILAPIHSRRSPESTSKTPATDTALTVTSASLIHSLAMVSDTLMNFRPARGARWILRFWSPPSHLVLKISLASLSLIFQKSVPPGPVDPRFHSSFQIFCGSKYILVIFHNCGPLFDRPSSYRDGCRSSHC